MTRPRLAYLCVHNSCRSQIAEALTKFYGRGRLDVYSAGTRIKDGIDENAVRLIKDIYDIDMEESQRPKLVDELPRLEYVISMGCNVVCPDLPYDCQVEDWGLDDPSGGPDQAYIQVIKEIDERVKNLLKKAQGMIRLKHLLG